MWNSPVRFWCWVINTRQNWKRGKWIMTPSNLWACNCARTISERCMAISNYSRTPQDRWCITPHYNWITQPPEQGEVICPGGLERRGASDCPGTDSDTGQCFPHCLSAPWKHRVAPILTRLLLFRTASNWLGDDGVAKLIFFRVFTNVPQLAEISTSTVKRKKELLSKV